MEKQTQKTPVVALPSVGTGAGGFKAHAANPNTIMSRKLLDTYFQTFDYPFVRHHIDSYDNFISQDIPAIIKANNPFMLLKQLIPGTNQYMYRVEVFIGGLEGNEIEIGTPTISLQKTKEVRVLFPNEARLRNLTYASTVYANVLVRVTYAGAEGGGQGEGEATENQPMIQEYKRMPLFQIPILLHSRCCILHGKPASFLQEAGECPQDQGGYFVVEGSEKILITRQEQAFNTMYVQPQPRDPKVATYGNLSCLSPITRQVKVVSFHWMRSTDSLVVTLPYVRKPVPVFVLFRAMGVQSDKDILRLIYPDLNSSEAKQMTEQLMPSIAEAFPFLDTFSAIQYIKAMTKGFSENHVYDILFNQTFIHITDKQGGSRLHFLAECVRKFMRVHTGVDPKSDRDDTRNQRCLTSGFLVRMLFTNTYNNWKKAVRLAIDREFEENKSVYEGRKFIHIFSEGNTAKLFKMNMLTEGIMKGFKGKWVTGGAGGGGALGHSDEKTGVLQAMSRMSYLDFMSHCRRVSLNFDTGMKLTGPRQLHGSQYGFFCTNETPGGASIGIAKNLSLMTLISSATNPDPIVACLYQRGWVIPCSEMRTDLQLIGISVSVNNGIIGYTLSPFELVKVMKLMKWTGCLPALSSVGFNMRNRSVFLYVDEGRPMRPLIHLNQGEGAEVIPITALKAARGWRELVLGSFAPTAAAGVTTTGFTDPFADTPGQIPLTQYMKALKPYAGVIEYVDPYEQNEAFIINFPEHLTPEASHMEVHPCTIISVVNGMVPFANFNQSPRNQLSCSQSKQGLGMYATNFQNRYDNAANILCYGEGPLVRTLSYDVLGGGMMPYGTNLIMAIMPFNGYNQDDGIIFNYDSFQRGMFRSINYRSYETFEEIDRMAGTTSVIGNPGKIPQWTDLKPGRDYSKLDERGIVLVGSLVDENTVLVGKYIQDKSGKIKDASLTPQVWTSGRVESVVVTINNMGLMLVKVRITQDRIPELGDKFSTRHGQKGTIGMLYRAHDLPRAANGQVPDMFVNPHCIPSRMTVAQLMEMLFGQVCYENSMIGDATIFTSDPSAPEAIGRILEGQFGLEKNNNFILYDGASGKQMETSVFMGPVFGMRLKHMTEDKWNARAEGRREQKTRQPTGGRGQQGGLRIGEMERDALAGHGVSGFLRESLMERADKAQIRICNGCGTVPIYNDQQKLLVCSLCDGPVQFIGTNSTNIEILPAAKKTLATTSIVEMPYATKLLADELQTYLNMGIRIITSKGLAKLGQPELALPKGLAEIQAAIAKPLPERILPETRVPEFREPVEQEEVQPAEEDLYAMGVIKAPSVSAASAASAAYAAAAEEESAPPLSQGTPAYAEVTPPEIVRQRMEAPPPSQGTPPGTPPQPLLAPQQQPLLAPQQQPLLATQQPLLATQQQPLLATQQQPFLATQQSGGSYMIPTMMQSLLSQQQPIIMQQQPQQMMQQMMQSGGAYMSPAPIVYQAPVPNAPQTIVIDTSPQAMDQYGYLDDMQMASRGMPVMGSMGLAAGARQMSGGANQHGGRRVTPRPNRAFGGRSSGQAGQASQQQGPISSSARVTVQKLG
jgi:DNA-directed RNA polymerase II subunit RPB2